MNITRSVHCFPLASSHHFWEVLFRHRSKAKTWVGKRKKKAKEEERCGNGKNTSNYIENMIILCRFFLLSLHKTFLPLHFSTLYTCSVEETKRRTMEMLRVRSCFAKSIVPSFTSKLESTLQSGSHSSETYFFHHINNKSSSHFNPRPPLQTHKHETTMNGKLLCCQHHPSRLSVV